MTAPITLLTDFGLRDGYVAAMKGVILSIAPTAKLVDLTHLIPPQDVLAARFQLMNTLPYFSQGTIHIAVVDPGVGSGRRGVAIAYDMGYLVGPDNGIFSGVLADCPSYKVVELTNEQFWRSDSPSRTFHGRDIFAPVGAHLSMGVPLEHLGESIDPASLVQVPGVSVAASISMVDELSGVVQAIDGFGNVISTIPQTVVQTLRSQGRSWHVRVGDRQIASGRTYSDVEAGGLVALVGSHGWVEVAMNGGNGAETLQLSVGDFIRIDFW